MPFIDSSLLLLCTSKQVLFTIAVNKKLLNFLLIYRVGDAADGTGRRLAVLSHAVLLSLLLHVAEHEAVASLDESLASSCTTSESLYGDRPSTDINTSTYRFQCSKDYTPTVLINMSVFCRLFHLQVGP